MAAILDGSTVAYKICDIDTPNRKRGLGAALSLLTPGFPGVTFVELFVPDRSDVPSRPVARTFRPRPR